MKVRDILPDRPLDQIMVRTNSPIEGKECILFGYCAWDGTKLISLDGDFYSLDEEIYKYEWQEDYGLVYWIHSEWSNDDSHVVFRQSQKTANRLCPDQHLR